ncbi:hypothetical protein C8Q74DRAFT_1362824 [Fomes fomentarius]|nr:hypothetical protein C8Q74DRAFT_1362824 [Fomes fomentarius]
MSSAAVLSLRPEDVSEATTSHTTMTRLHHPPLVGILGVGGQNPHQHVTLTTNIALESRADSAAVRSFDARSSKATEETVSTAV